MRQLQAEQTFLHTHVLCSWVRLASAESQSQKADLALRASSISWAGSTPAAALPMTHSTARGRLPLGITTPSNLLTHCRRKRAGSAGLLCNQAKLTWVTVAEVGQQTLTQPALLPTLGDVISISVPARGLRGRSQRSNHFSTACLWPELPSLSFLFPTLLVEDIHFAWKSIR